eukprot:2953306-Rhodomonas_salina.1
MSSGKTTDGSLSLVHYRTRPTVYPGRSTELGIPADTGSDSNTIITMLRAVCWHLGIEFVTLRPFSH